MRIFETFIEKTEEVKKDGRVGNMSYLKKHAEIKENVVLDDGQESIRKQLEELIDDSSMNVIGLEGEWGSGKSTILKALKEKNRGRYSCYEYDLWTHQEDNLRYSFLRGMLENYKYVTKNKVNNNFEERMEDLISSQKKSDGPKINYKMVGVIFAMLFLSIFSDIAGVLWSKTPIVYVIAFFFFPMAIVSLLFLNNNKEKINKQEIDEKIKEEKTQIKKSNNRFFLIAVPIILAITIVTDFIYGFGVRDIAQKIIAIWENKGDAFYGFFFVQEIEKVIVAIVQFLSLCFIGVFTIKMLRKTPAYVKNPYVKKVLMLYNEKFVETSYSREIQPRMEDARNFMNDFFDDLRKREKGRIVIIFDNLDRLPASKITEFWTFLQTFFVEKNNASIITIVAFERKTVENAWEKEAVGAAYLEKTLDITVYVPLCSRKDLKNFFMNQWEEVFAKDDDNVDGTGENVFDLYHLLKKEDVSFSSRRGVIDAINEIRREKDKIHTFFQGMRVQGNLVGDRIKIEYPCELAAMYVFKRKYINEMFSETVKEGVVKYYIEAFATCKDWVSQYIPEVDDDGKKMCLQRIFNQIIQNKDKNANNMNSYYIIDFFYKGKLEYYFNSYHDVKEFKDDSGYICEEAIERIEDNGIDISNAIKSLLFCQQKKILKPREMRIKWGLLLKKIRILKKWPEESWYWNALISNAGKYLKERVWERDVMIADPRKNFVIEDIKTYYSSNENNLKGKIILTADFLKSGYSWNFSAHDFAKDGKIFFYEDDIDRSRMKKQLDSFKQDDWKRSLENFWYPGVVQYYGIKKKLGYNKRKWLNAALKDFFKLNVHILDYQKGPCKKDKSYYKIWLELIEVLSVDDMSKLKENIKNFFPKEYHAKLDEVFKKKGVN